MKQNKALKKFLLEILSKLKESSGNPVVEPGIKTAPSTAPSTNPTPQRRRKLAPDHWPEETPGPKPKAEGEEKIGIEEIIKEIKMVYELSRMQTLIFENTQLTQEMSMNIEDPDYEQPHPSVRKGIEGGKKTAFTDSEFFGGGLPDYSTLERLGSEEFNKIIADIKPLGKMSSPQEFATAFQLMSSIEMQYKTALESLTIRKVKEQFGLPDEISDKLEAKLVRSIQKPDEDTDNLAQDVVQELEFTDEEKEIVKQHVEKRKIQNALMMGAGFKAHSTFRSIKNDLDAIDVRLFPLYEKTMPNVALFMWKYPFEDMMGAAQMMGLSKIKKDENNNVKAEAQATIFPILLHETAKAAIELLFANYLISLTERFGAGVASEVIKQADVFEDEIWYKRIGPTLWKKLHDVIDYIIVKDKGGNYNLVAYLLSDISMMEPAEFLDFMNTLVYDGEDSVNMITNMIDDIERDLSSEEPMPAQTDDENLRKISDEVGDELIGLIQGAKKKEQATAQVVVPKNYEEMSLEELQAALQTAVDDERYEDAAKIVKIIKAKS